MSKMLSFKDEQLVEYMIAGTTLKITQKCLAASQLAHLRKYEQRSVKRLAKETKLPESCIRRFKAKKTHLNRKGSIVPQHTPSERRKNKKKKKAVRTIKKPTTKIKKK